MSLGDGGYETAADGTIREKRATNSSNRAYRLQDALSRTGQARRDALSKLSQETNPWANISSRIAMIRGLTKAKHSRRIGGKNGKGRGGGRPPQRRSNA